MPEQQREALDHIAGKLSRIFSGQAGFVGHWEDVSGYAELARLACSPSDPPVVLMPNGFMDAAGNWVPAPYEK